MAKGAVAALIALHVTGAAAQQVLLDQAAALRGIQLGTPVPEKLMYCRALIAEAQSGSAPELANSRYWEAPCIESMGAFEEDQGWYLPQVRRLEALPGFVRNAGIVIADGRIEQVETYFSPERYADVLQALKEKYGRPSIERTRTFTNRYGRVTTGEFAAWIGPGAMLEIEQYRSGPGRYGYVTLSSRTYLDRLKTEREKTRSELKQGL